MKQLKRRCQRDERHDRGCKRLQRELVQDALSPSLELPSTSPLTGKVDSAVQTNLDPGKWLLFIQLIICAYKLKLLGHHRAQASYEQFCPSVQMRYEWFCPLPIQASFKQFWPGELKAILLYAYPGELRTIMPSRVTNKYAQGSYEQFCPGSGRWINFWKKVKHFL